MRVEPWLLSLALFSAQAAPTGPELDQRVEALARELRCLVCQNQSLADSSAPLAQDLKALLRRELAAGKSEEAVRQHLVARYGEVLLYKPPLHAGTALLWGAPLALAGLGLALLLRQRRRAGGEPA